MDTNNELVACDPQPVIWMTGLPGSGKTTIARALDIALSKNNVKAVVLDGDVVRKGLCSDLGFSDADRIENVRRIAHVAKMFQRTGHVVIVATVSPLAAQRELARSIIGAGFLETFIFAPAVLCAQRDPKGMYAQAKAGKLPKFTGVSAPFESPVAPDLTIDTARCRVEVAVATLAARLGTGAPVDDAQEFVQQAVLEASGRNIGH